MLGDLINSEIGNIAFGVDEHYQWQLLELTFNANKLIFQCFEKTATDDVPALLAVKKLRTRVLQANDACRKAICDLQKNTYKEHSKDEAV